MPILTAAFVYLLQSDSGAGPAAPIGIAGFGAIADLMGNIGPVAIGVLLLLLFASLYSWTVILGKISTFGRATKESRKFIRAFRKATQLKEISCAGEATVRRVLWRRCLRMCTRPTSGRRAALDRRGTLLRWNGRR